MATAPRCMDAVSEVCRWAGATGGVVAEEEGAGVGGRGGPRELWRLCMASVAEQLIAGGGGAGVAVGHPASTLKRRALRSVMDRICEFSLHHWATLSRCLGPVRRTSTGRGRVAVLGHK